MPSKPIHEEEVPAIHDPNNPQVRYTQPVATPEHPHVQYEYEYGNMRRCHLCGAMEDHLNNTAEGVWFASLEDKCRHVMECHRQFPIEVSRAEEVLGIARIWDQENYKNDAKARGLHDVDARQGMPMRRSKQEQENRQQSIGKTSWFRRHPKLTIVLLIIGAYIAYSLYLVIYQGYTF